MIDLVIRKSLHSITALFQPSSAFRVIFSLISVTVTIYLNDVLLPGTNKIHDEIAQRVLSPKTKPTQPMVTQPCPQLKFGWGHITPEFFGAMENLWGRAFMSHGRSPNTPPPGLPPFERAQMGEE